MIGAEIKFHSYLTKAAHLHINLGAVSCSSVFTTHIDQNLNLAGLIGAASLSFRLIKTDRRLATINLIKVKCNELSSLY